MSLAAPERLIGGHDSNSQRALIRLTDGPVCSSNCLQRRMLPALNCFLPPATTAGFHAANILCDVNDVVVAAVGQSGGQLYGCPRLCILYAPHLPF